MNNRKFLNDLAKNAAFYNSVGEVLERNHALIASIGNQASDIVSRLNLVNFTVDISAIHSLLEINSRELSKAVEISTAVFNSVKIQSIWDEAYSRQISSMTEALSSAGKLVAADLAAINLSAFNISTLGIFDELFKLVDYHKDSAEAFKSAGWTIAPSMDRILIEKIVALHHQGKTKYISQAILGYYRGRNFEKLRSMVASWETNPLFSSRMHIFEAALKAHCDGDFTLSVPALLSQIEGIMNEYVKVNNLAAKLGKIEKVYNAVVGDLNDYPLGSWAIANTLLYQLRTNTFTYTDFEVEFKKSSNTRKATRHTVLHGISVNYDKPIHSLKAFILLDALSSLQEPK